MSGWAPALAAVLLLPLSLAAGAPPMQEEVSVDFALPELTVTAPPPAAEHAGTLTPAAPPLRLHAEPGVHLRTQGLPTGQADLSIRGSSFSGAGLAVGGLALRNPQTEHFHAELPLSPLLFAEPARQTGLEQARGGTGFLVGTLDYDFLPVAAAAGQAEAGVGESGRDWQGLFLQQPLVRTPQPLTPGLSLFGARERAARTDAWPDNDLERWNGGAHLQLRSARQQTDLVAASQQKAFGARGFYGAPASLPSEEELRDRLFLITSRRAAEDDGFLRAGLAWRELRDEYRLDRRRPWLYENRHRSTLLTAQIDGRESLADALALNWRAAAEEERLASSYAGTLPGAGLGEARRQRGEIMLLPETGRGPLRLSLGGRAVVFSDDRPAWLPLAGFEYRAGERHTLSLAYSETVRQPSYTELNYESPGSLGNRGLARQHDRTLELAWQARADPGWRWRAALFAGESRGSVDWVKSGPGARWVATDLGAVRLAGGEVSLRRRLGERADLGLAYTVLRKDSDVAPYASRYVLDYAEHRLLATAHLRLPAGCALRFAQGFERQTANPVRTSGRDHWPAALELRVPLPRLPVRTTLVLGVDNLWDSRFETYPAQPPAGRRVSAAVVGEW